nr:molecular chaperone DnaJ [Enterococcus faecalis]
FKDIINKLFNLKMDGVAIEVVGTFIWLTGNTKPYKDDIKALEFRYSPKKYAWYKAPSDYKKRSRKNYDMDTIRGMYGSQKIKEEKEEKKYLQAN